MRMCICVFHDKETTIVIMFNFLFFLFFKLKNYETSQKSKENENNVENEVVSIERSTKKKGRKKEVPSLVQPEIIDLSGSESK